MPIYEYRCQQCGELFEKFVRSVANLREVQCPHCGGTQTERSLSVFSTSGTSRGSTANAPAPTGSTCQPSG
jgi:putative FmdB family regulatory protein